MGINKQKHFNLMKREILFHYMKEKASLIVVAEKLGLDPTSISREIKRNRVCVSKNSHEDSLCYSCNLRNKCKKRFVCNNFNCDKFCAGCPKVQHCINYREFICKEIKKFPYCCNFCNKRSYCTLPQYRYSVDVAELKANERKLESRSGADLSIEEYNLQNDLLLNLLRNNKQSLNHILHNHQEEFHCSLKTLYRRIDKGVYAVKNYDLSIKPRLKERKHISDKYNYKHAKYLDRVGHLWSDFLVFKMHSQLSHYFEMDFLGKPMESRKEILVFRMVEMPFVIMRIVEDTTSEKIIEILNEFEEIMGLEMFQKIFPAILTDRDVVFDDFNSLEFNKNSIQRTKIFYCNSSASWQKAFVENMNKDLRTIFPKHAILNNLTQADVDYACSQMNSRCLNSIDNTTPYDLFYRVFGKEILDKLRIKKIHPDDVKLKPIC